MYHRLPVIRRKVITEYKFEITQPSLRAVDLTSQSSPNFEVELPVFTLGFHSIRTNYHSPLAKQGDRAGASPL